MTAFLTPATRLMSRLTITRKLVLLSVLFLIPLCGAMFAVLNQSVQSIRDTQDEQRGLKLVGIALDFMRETQVRRGAANGVLLGNTSFRPTFEAADGKAAQHLASLLGETGAIESFAIVPDVQKLDESWQQIRKLGLDTPAAPLFERHTALVKQTRLFIGDVADHSSLALDPEAGSYYLINLTVGPMPKLAEVSALARGRGAGIIAQGGYSDAASRPTWPRWPTRSWTGWRLPAATWRAWSAPRRSIKTGWARR